MHFDSVYFEIFKSFMHFLWHFIVILKYINTSNNINLPK